MRARRIACRASLKALSAAVVSVCLASSAGAAPPSKAPLRVAVAPVAERRALYFPDSLPLHVELPYETLTAQPRRVPEQVYKRLRKVLSSMEGLVVVQAPELGPYPRPEEVRAAAGRRGIDAVLVAAVTIGYGQMRTGVFRRRFYEGRVQVEVDILSGRTGRPLSERLVLEGDDDIEVNFRRPLDFETLHHRGVGPEVRERVEWSIREIGDLLEEKLSAAWLEAVLAEESRLPDARAAARLGISRVALEPEAPRVGHVAKMIISYEVSGLDPGDVITVTETRRLVRDGQLVAGPFRTVRDLGNGNHTSVQELHVPTEAEGGLYTILGSVEAGGARAEGAGSFTVLAPE